MVQVSLVPKAIKQQKGPTPLKKSIGGFVLKSIQSLGAGPKMLLGKLENPR